MISQTHKKRYRPFEWLYDKKAIEKSAINTIFFHIIMAFLFVRIPLCFHTDKKRIRFFSSKFYPWNNNAETRDIRRNSENMFAHNSFESLREQCVKCCVSEKKK